MLRLQPFLSLQSKSTKVVSDSSDDYWFLEEDVTVEMVEVDSENEDPPFQEEYEVDSDGSSHHEEEEKESSEEPSEEEVIIKNFPNILDSF